MSSVLTHSVVIAAESDDTPAASFDVSELMTKAKDNIDVGKYKKATKQLNKVVEEDDNNADAWNLLGYSWRKLDENRKSSKAYVRALEINPEHKGALEYQGELFIKLGELDNAKSNLELLRQLCPEGCSESEDLAKALAGKSSY
jgi:Flp pilus assembly protein TadD